MPSPRRAAVVGAGYVGLATAVGLARLGHHVTLLEVDPARMAMLAAGRLPIHEPGLDEAFRVLREQDRLELASEAPSDADIVFVCVGTPIDETGTIELTALETALAGLRRVVEAGTPVCIRSTLPPGGSEGLADRLELSRRHLLTNPEFLAQGSALEGFLRPSRIVIGRFPETDDAHVRLLLDVFDGIDAPRMVVDVATAELIKNGANAYLQMRLSFVNELAALAEHYGADADEVLEGMGHDPRIGQAYRNPSPGVGGSCLPNASLVLDTAARSADLGLPLLPVISRSNREHRRRFVERSLAQAGNLGVRRVAVLGLAFKPGTDDVRDSVAIELCRALLDGGFEVFAYDPLAADNARRALPGLTVCATPEDAVAAAELTLVATAWPEFAEISARRA